MRNGEADHRRRESFGKKTHATFLSKCFCHCPDIVTGPATGVRTADAKHLLGRSLLSKRSAFAGGTKSEDYLFSCDFRARTVSRPSQKNKDSDRGRSHPIHQARDGCAIRGTLLNVSRDRMMGKHGRLDSFGSIKGQDQQLAELSSAWFTEMSEQRTPSSSLKDDQLSIEFQTKEDQNKRVERNRIARIVHEPELWPQPKKRFVLKCRANLRTDLLKESTLFDEVFYDIGRDVPDRGILSHKPSWEKPIPLQQCTVVT